MALSTWKRGSSVIPRTTYSLPSDVRKDLWDRLHAILGSKWLDLFNGADMELAKQEWELALGDFKPVELGRGLDAVAHRKFVPTLGEFACLCRPALDPEWAFREAEVCLRQRDAGQVGDWSHPAVWRAASVLSLEVRQSDYSKVKTRWSYTLRAELAKGWGEWPPQPPLKLSRGEKITADSEVARRERKRIAEILGRLQDGGK